MTAAADPRDGVLLVRLGAVGDIVHALPTAHALRRARPEARIVWAVEDRWADLLRGNPDVDAVLPLPRRPWRNGWAAGRRGARAALRQLRGAGCAVALDLQGLTKSALAAWISGARLRIGFDGSEPRSGRELAPFLDNRLVRAEATHVVERNLELLRPLGVEPPRPGGADWFPRPAPETETVERFLAEHDLAPGAFAVLHPSAGWPAKEWPRERFVALARGLRERSGLRSVVTWGGPREADSARAVVASAGEMCIMAPETDLPELWSLLARAELCVGGDTGPVHMAAAAGTRCVALFGPTDGARNGPYGPAHAVVQGRCERHPLCWKRRWRARCRCMESIDVAPALEACERVRAARDDGEARCS